ncbi:MAG: hypothetical protein WDW38_006527 [Sanguina aurantia]
MLSDGVFAIAMTLSAVELKPEARPGASLAELWTRPLLTYFMSFAIIAGVWMRHRRALAHLRCVDNPMTFITLLLLSLVALMPVVIRQLLEGGADWISAGMLVYSVSLMAIYAILARVGAMPRLSRGWHLTWRGRSRSPGCCRTFSWPCCSARLRCIARTCPSRQPW